MSTLEQKREELKVQQHRLESLDKEILTVEAKLEGLKTQQRRLSSVRQSLLGAQASQAVAGLAHAELHNVDSKVAELNAEQHTLSTVRESLVGARSQLNAEMHRLYGKIAANEFQRGNGKSG